MSQQLSGTIAFASGKTGDYDIWTCNLKSGQLTQLTFGDCWNDKPTFSPGGQWVAFVSNRTGSQEIFKTPAAGGEVIQLTDLGGRWGDSPAFSPDGKSIAFISNEAGSNDIWLMDTEGRERVQVTTHEGSDTTVAWTPDGQGLLWSSDRGDDADIWHYDLVSGAKTQLNEDRGADFSPTPSPDGSLVAFVSNRQLKPNPDKPFTDRDKDIWMMTRDGQFPVKLTENQGTDFVPCWSPCGNYLLYVADDLRNDCHLRLLNVADLVRAYASGDSQSIERAASSLKHKAIELDRHPLKQEIDAQRHATLLTAWLPESWVKSCYPSGYFGLERSPAWTAVEVTADQQADAATLA